MQAFGGDAMSEALPEIERPSVRVMVFDARGLLLLLHTTDPAEPERGSCWELPGGGIETGESGAEAASRELYEETGIQVDDVGTCVAVVEGAFSFNGCEYRQHEHIFRVRVDDSVCEPAALDSDLERAAHLGHRWWHVADVLATEEHVYPPALPELLTSVSPPPERLSGSDPRALVE
jgi:8-oxo-dGTP pyrophosphatase MutT (NUDIX family)